MKKVAVIMGSDTDFPVVSQTIETLKDLQIPFEAHVISAHRTPQQASDFARNAAENNFGVIIAAAGKAAHLAGFLAANTVLPVIGIPVKASELDGMDALLATIQMPPGVPVATVTINGAKNAALLAAQIIALSEPALDEKLKEMKLEMAEAVAQKDKTLQDKISAL
jgi:5-(carboxyamino)imidazole ribonucleotide mutase